MFQEFILEVAKPHRRVFISLILLTIFIFLIGFAVTLVFVESRDLNFDLTLAEGIQAIKIPYFKNVMVFVSLFGQGLFPIITFSLVALWLFRSGFRKEVAFLPGVWAAPLISEVSKIAISRPRPEEQLVAVYGSFPGFSFPSGHVLFYTVFFGFVAFLAFALPRINPVARIVAVSICLFLVLSVGVSRVFLGAHWPTDVIAAYLIGLALLEILTVSYVRFIYLPNMGAKEENSNDHGRSR